MHRPLRVSEPRVLVTAFPPFSDFDSNVSQSVLERLEVEGVQGLDIVTCILSVDEDGSRAVAEQMRNDMQVDGILHLGLAARRESISLERLARNEYSMNEPDNSGRFLESGTIIQGAPATLQTTAPVHVIDEEFEHDEHIHWSEDAGGYVCNETIYRTLHAMQAREEAPLPALFVHLPPEGEVPLDVQIEAVGRIATCLVCRPTYDVVGGLLFDADGRILACRRPKGDAWAGWWEFPGGKIEPDEDSASALIRELIEEIGVSVEPKYMVEKLLYEYDDRSVRLQIWDCGVINPASIRLVEHDEARWLSTDELLDVKWLPADLPLIERWRREGIPRP